MTFFDAFSTFRLVGANRGYRAIRPENSLAAFGAALGRCHFILLNVRLSSDLVPMVIHDADLSRTTDAASRQAAFGLNSLKVGRWSQAQLKTLDVGSWFLDADPFETLASGKINRGDVARCLPQTMLSLEEVLSHYSLRRIAFNVVIQDHRGDRLAKVATEKVLAAIRRSSAVRRVLLSSSNHDYLMISKSLLPELSTAAIQNGPHPENIVEYLRAINVAAYHSQDQDTDSNMIHELRTAGLGSSITTNSQARQKQLYRDGATAIISDFPSL